MIHNGFERRPDVAGARADKPAALCLLDRVRGPACRPRCGEQPERSVGGKLVGQRHCDHRKIDVRPQAGRGKCLMHQIDGDIRQSHGFKQRRSARIDVGIERVAETRQRVATLKPSLHAGFRALSPGVVEQRTDPQAGAAMHRTQQRRQAGQHRGGKRCAGRCRDAGSEGRRVELVIGRQHQGDADRLAGVRAAVPGAGKAFCDRDAIGKVGAECARQRAQQHRCFNHKRRSCPALGRVAAGGSMGQHRKRRLHRRQVRR